MASPPPDAIRAVTGEGAQVSRGLWEIEHGAGLAGRTTFADWAQQRYGLSRNAAGFLMTYLLRIREIGQELANREGVVPRGSQARNPDLPMAYRVRVYANIGAAASGRENNIPLEFDLTRNPTLAVVHSLVLGWYSHQHRQTAMRTFHGYDQSRPLLSYTIRSLECRTC